MEHQEIKDKLFEFRGREMSEDERREIAVHLELCSECRTLFSRWERTGAMLRRVPFPQNSEDFTSRVMGRLEAMEEPAEEPAFRWQLPRWIIMGLGYSFGVFLMFAAIANRQPIVNADTVLQADMPQSTQWTYAAENPESGQVMDYIKEEL